MKFRRENGKHNVKNRVNINTENAVLGLTAQRPESGPVIIANKLKEQGISVTYSGVYGVWGRNDLNTPEKRIKFAQNWGVND